MIDLDEIYEKEKLINSYFKKKYDYSDRNVFNKQILELICELSEFAYETKCFKYWKNEKPSSPDITIPEFADCLMIVFSLCDLAGIEKLEIETLENHNMVELFIEANKLASSLSMELNIATLQKILSCLIAISKLLNYSDAELKNYCEQKMQKTLDMIKKIMYNGD